MDWTFLLKSVVGLVAVTDPLGVVPIFISVTRGQRSGELRRVALLTTLTVLVTLTVFALIGQGILWMFGVTLPALRVGGGLLLVVMALPMLQGMMSPGKQNPTEAAEIAERRSVAIVPLGIPLLAGPGAISAVMLLAQQAETVDRVGSLAIAIAVTTLLVFVALRLSGRLHRYLGQTEQAIITRLVGLVMLVMGVQFMADGLVGLFPLLAGS
jgi:multiple antibiotic resistance protein